MTFMLNVSLQPFCPATVIGTDLAGTGPFVRILDEAASDIAQREALLDQAFGPARAAKTSERLREGRRPAEGLALVAKDAGELVGTLRLWHIDAAGRPALLLGPLAVAESHRSFGIGAQLVSASLARAAARGHGGVLLVGDAPYYQRFGFERRLTEKLILPGPVDRQRFLGFELKPGALSGAAGRVHATGAPVAAPLPRRALPQAA